MRRLPSSRLEKVGRLPTADCWQKRGVCASACPDPAGRVPTAEKKEKKYVSERWLPGRLQRARLLCRSPPTQPAEEEKEEDKVVAGKRVR